MCTNLDEVDHAHRVAIASDVLLGVGVAAVATGVVLFIVEAKRRPRAPAAAGFTILGLRAN
jgi:hypothetical protein